MYEAVPPTLPQNMQSHQDFISFIQGELTYMFEKNYPITSDYTSLRIAYLQAMLFLKKKAPKQTVSFISDELYRILKNSIFGGMFSPSYRLFWEQIAGD